MVGVAEDRKSPAACWWSAYMARPPRGGAADARRARDPAGASRRSGWYSPMPSIWCDGSHDGDDRRHPAGDSTSARARSMKSARSHARRRPILSFMDCALRRSSSAISKRHGTRRCSTAPGLFWKSSAARAKTKEGTLQVELAHLNYQRSRLVRVVDASRTSARRLRTFLAVRAKHTETPYRAAEIPTDLLIHLIKVW